MNKTIIILTDYKNRFGTRYDSFPYRSGMDKELLATYFKTGGFETAFLPFSQVNFRDIDWENKYVLYTSQEDRLHLYRSYIEDVVYSLELAGANVLPAFKYLRAHDNKVFMEMLLAQMFPGEFLKTMHFGTYEELANKIDNISFPIVIKGARGAMSRSVAIAKDRKELFKLARKFSSSKNLIGDLKDAGRKLKHKGYIKESLNRNKFILQEFISGLKNDWKVLVYGRKIYILYRGVKKNDFRASGSKIFKFNDDDLIPKGVFDYAYNFYRLLNVPSVSLDIVFKNNKFQIVEFQTINFGTSTQLKSNGYFQYVNNEWVKQYEKLDIEQVYVDSIVEFINKS